MEGDQKRSEKESAGDGFKLLVSQADIGSSAAWLSSTSHTISPLFAISPLSISLHLLLWCSESQCDALFLSPSHSCQRYCIYPSLSFWLSLDEKKTISHSHMQSIFPLFLTYRILHHLAPFFFLHTLCLSVSLHTFPMPFTPASPYTPSSIVNSNAISIHIDFL